MSVNLDEWQKKRLTTIHTGMVNYRSGRKDVTLLAYYFRPVQDHKAMWPRLECAIRDTWLWCGLLSTVIVVDRIAPCVATFAKTFANVEFQIEPSLVPGDIFSMSADCNGRLSKRFKTDYVLIVQDDGFPLRVGLDNFVGRYDFIGAPYVRPRLVPQLLARLSGCWVMNGGFSLRSHELCDFAAFHWNRKYNALGDCKATSEDLFFSQTLPLREPSFRHRFRLPTTKEAIAFAWDAIVPIPPPPELPFGFHRATSFLNLYDKFHKGKSKMV